MSPKPKVTGLSKTMSNYKNWTDEWKEDHRQKMRGRYLKRKQDLVAHFGGKCIHCGYSKCVAALEFHHRDPATKSFELSQNALGKSWNNIIAEAEKCDLVCSNCHAEIHYGFVTQLAE